MQTFEEVKQRFLQVDHPKNHPNVTKPNIGNDDKINNSISNPISNVNVTLSQCSSFGVSTRCDVEKATLTVDNENLKCNSSSLCTGDKCKKSEPESTPAKMQKTEMTKQPLCSKYSAAQCEQLKRMTKEEKKAIQCHKCGEHFHTGVECQCPSKLCFNCLEYGHEARNCTKPKRKGIISELNEVNVDKLKSVSFLADSGASHSMVNTLELLRNYQKFENPRPVHTALNTDDSCYSLAEGILKIVLTFNNEQTLLDMKHVQYVPNISDLVISCKAFNAQFKTSFVLNINTGHIISRKLKLEVAHL